VLLMTWSVSDPVLLAVLFFGTAVLYSSVGNAGASGYLAAMTLAGLPPEVMKSTALLLNIIVACITAGRFYRAGHFSWELFWPFTVASLPCAFLGGVLVLPGAFYQVIVGIVLVFAAYRLFWFADQKRPHTRAVPRMTALLLGACLGFVSGLTGIGGGIFLGPLLLGMGWAAPHQSASVSAAFILVNSVAALCGETLSMHALPSAAPLWAGTVLLGGLVGSELGARQLAEVTLRRLLAVVLAIAGLKLIFVRR
jgi:uncharacterized membrane protein YfcA